MLGGSAKVAAPAVNQTIKHFPPASPNTDPQTTAELTSLRTMLYGLLDRVNTLETKISAMAGAPLTEAQLQQVSKALSIAGKDGKTRLNVTQLLGQS